MMEGTIIISYFGGSNTIFAGCIYLYPSLARLSMFCYIVALIKLTLKPIYIFDRGHHSLFGDPGSLIVHSS